MSNDLVLYTHPMSRGRVARWLLEEIGQPYRAELLEYGTTMKGADYLAINPMGKVPALRHGDTIVTESAAICAYIAERCPEAGLAPKIGDPLRGRYFHWLFFAPGCIEPAFTQKFTNIELPTTAAGWGDFTRVFDALETALKPGPWILGETFSAADVMIGCDLLFGVERFKIVEPRPVFVAYLERCHARPALQRALAIDAAGVSSAATAS